MDSDQPSFTHIEYGNRRRISRRERFLETMDATIPWQVWVGLIEPHYYADKPGKRGRKAKPITTMLRMYLLQVWLSLSDEGVEEAIYDSYAMRRFMGLDFALDQVPDATTLLHFRHLLEDHKLMSELAAKLVLTELLPAFATEHEGISNAELAELIVKVAAWAQLNEPNVAVAGRAVLASLEWSDAPEAWGAKVLVHRVLRDVANSTSVDDQSVLAVIVADQTAMLSVLGVDEELITKFIELAEGLPEPSRDRLAEQVAADYEPASGEVAAAFLLDLELRRLTGRSAPTSSDLEAVSPTPRIVDAWLALAPPASAVAEIILPWPGTSSATRAYASALSTEDRTALWVALESPSARRVLLTDVGAGGVGASAVEHCQAVVKRETQQSERREAVGRLCSARPAKDSTHVTAALRRAAGDLASTLLGQSGGDLRTAADLMVWAGGSSPQHDPALRDRFERQVEAHPESPRV